MLDRSPILARLCFLLACGVACATAGCGGKTKDDIYMEGLKLEGEAERGVCKLHYGDGQMMQAMSGDRVQRCLRATEDALALYEQAANMGMADVDFQRVHARAKERQTKLTAMLTQVRAMEREQAPPTI